MGTKFVTKAELFRARTARQPQRNFYAADIVPIVKNTTGGTLDRFSILGVDDVIFDPGESEDHEDVFKSSFAFVGKKPDLTRDGLGRFCVIQQSVEDNDVVPCVVTGLTVCHIELPDDAMYTGASLRVDDETKLQAIGPDCAIVWHETGPGKKLAVVHLGASPPVLLGKTAEALTAGTAGDVGVWDIDSNSDDVGDEGATSTTLECYPYTDMDSGIWVSIFQQRFGYVAFPRECNA